jgi:hypothetical protein
MRSYEEPDRGDFNFRAIARSKREGRQPEAANETLTMPKYLRIPVTSTITPAAKNPRYGRDKKFLDERNERLYGFDG